jgi:hypothetical protein
MPCRITLSARVCLAVASSIRPRGLLCEAIRALPLLDENTAEDIQGGMLTLPEGRCDRWT